MSIVINTEKGWAEAIIDGNCGFEKFYQAANILEQDRQINFISRLNDFDTLYWDFKHNESILTLYYNIYMGLSVFPKKFKLASANDNENAIEIGEFLFEKLKEK